MLPGFEQRLDAVGDVPGWARDWTWDAVVNATESDRWTPGVARWEPHSFECASTQSSYRKHVHDLPVDDRGAVLVPVDAPLPAGAQRDALSTYRAAVVEFAESFVFNASWSARAVHDAIRLRQPIRLPQRPEPFVALPLAESILLDPSQPLLRSDVIALAHALLAAVDQADAQSTYAVTRRSASNETTNLPSERLWTGAIDAVVQRLASQPVPSSLRQCAKRLRPSLDAAVSGVIGAAPLHRVDDPKYPQVRRRGRKNEGR